MKVKKWKMKKNAALALAVILMATGMDFPVYAEETNTAENQVVAENQEATVSPGDGESNEIMMTSLLDETIYTFAPDETKEIDGREYMAGADGARVAWAYDEELYLSYFVSVLEGEVEVETGLDASESLCIAYPDGEGGYTNLEKLTIDADGARTCVLGEERNCISMKARDVLTREEVYDDEETVVGKYEYFPEQDMESSVGLIFREGKVTIDPDSLLGGVSLGGYLRVTAPEGTTDVLEGIDWDDWDDGDGYDTACFGVEGDMILKEGAIVLRSDNSPTIRMKAIATYGITVSGNDMGVNALIQKDDSLAAGVVDGTALISMGPAGEDSFAMYGDPGEPLLVMSDGTVQPASQFSYDENGIYVGYGVFEHVSGNPEVTLHIENDTPAVTIGNNTEFVAYHIRNRGYIMGSGTLTCDEGISTYVIDGEAYKVTGVTMTGYAAFTEEDGVLVAADKSVVSVVSKDDGEKTCTVKVVPDPNPYVIYVGGVGMRNGEYLANGATSSSSSKPASGGYAYIKDNTLTLNNYSYEGPGYLYEPFYDEEEGACYSYTAALYSDYEAVLNVILEGENSLANTDSLEDNCLGHGMAAKGGLNIGGNGSLTIDSSQDGIFTDNEGVTVGGACVLEFSCGDDGICTFCDLKLCENCDVTLNAGDDGLDGAEVEITGNSKLTVYSDSDGIYSEEGNITIGGNSDVYVLVGSDGIETYGSIFISGDCTLKLYADDDGIAGGVQITDATVTIDAYDDGIDAYDEDIIITNSELIIRNAESGFENTQGDIIIDNSTVDILDVYCGIDCNNTGVTIRGNSTLEICDAQYGVYANKVAISDSTVLVTADDRAFVVYDSFDIAAGLSVMVPDGGVCRLYEEEYPAFQTILNEDGSLATSVLIAAECDHEYSDYYVYTGEGEKAPTCTKSGLGHKECTKCGTVMESGIVVNALGHDYRAEVTTEATTEKEGVRTYTCDNCGDSYTEKIPKLPKPTATPRPKPTATPEPTSKPDLSGLFASNEEGYFVKNGQEVRCYNLDGTPVINEFKCDGTYTYYFQADGTAMRDQLTYHPDGIHVIYFDESGHEVFSDFANIRKTISGETVDGYGFFDVYGHLYVDVVTYDKTGTYLYYANEYGVMDRGKWFKFSDTVKWADGTPFDKAGGEYGYANENGTLMTNTWTYDWQGTQCYMQGNGVALYP